jgi:hypothetical protein
MATDVVAEKVSPASNIFISAPHCFHSREFRKGAGSIRRPGA